MKFARFLSTGIFTNRIIGLKPCCLNCHFLGINGTYKIPGTNTTTHMHNLKPDSRVQIRQKRKTIYLLSHNKKVHEVEIPFAWYQCSKGIFSSEELLAQVYLSPKWDAANPTPAIRSFLLIRRDTCFFYRYTFGLEDKAASLRQNREENRKGFRLATVGMWVAIIALIINIAFDSLRYFEERKSKEAVKTQQGP